MTSRPFKILTILAVTSLVAGCKLAVMVPSGGDVTSGSGTRSCTGGNLCEYNITDTTFNETFTAVAKPGYVFSKWSPGPGFLCASSVNPVCTISNAGLGGIAGVDGVIATGQFFYAMPLFDFVGIDTDGDGIKDHLDADDDNDGIFDVDDQCPLVGPNLDGFGCPVVPDTDGDGLNDDVDPCPANPTNPCALITGADIVTAIGKEWTQPDLFTGLSWYEINDVCPGGACLSGGVLKGRDMTGWRWAYATDADDLINSYGVVLPPLVGQDFGDIYQIVGQFQFLTDFRGTQGPGRVFFILADPVNFRWPEYIVLASVFEWDPDLVYVTTGGQRETPDAQSTYFGAMFVR